MDRRSRGAECSPVAFIPPAGAPVRPVRGRNDCFQFGKATSFGIPAIDGVDPDVMAFPACTAVQGYVLAHGAAPNGAFGPGAGEMVSNYTLIFDIFYPTTSDGVYRAFFRTNTANSDDADFFLLNSTGGGPGISGNYRGSVTTGQSSHAEPVQSATPLFYRLAE